MIISFVGHRSMIISDNLSIKISEVIKANIKDASSIIFYCGGYGDFDNCCASVCRELKRDLDNCEMVFVTPYLTASQQKKINLFINTKLYDSIIYPPLENTPPRFTITKRNEWMIHNSDLIIAYVSHSYGGAYKTLKYAQKINKKIINLAENLK